MNKLSLLIAAIFASSAVGVIAADAEVKPKSATEQRAIQDKATTPEKRTGTMPDPSTPKPKSETEVRVESSAPTSGTADTKAKSAGNTDVGVTKPKSATDERRDMTTGKTTTYGGSNTGAMGTSATTSTSATTGSTSHTGMSMTGGMMGTHQMAGTVTKINHKTGKVTVNTEAGKMDVHFPSADIQDLKKGDTINVHLGYTRG